MSAAATPGDGSGHRRRWVRFGTGESWSAHQLALAATTSVGAVIYLVSLDRAAGGFDPVFWALGLVPIVLLRLNGSGAPLAYWALMLFGWFHLTSAGSFSWWAVPAAAGVLLGHAGAALSATAPPVADFPARIVRRWLLHGLWAFVAAVVVGLVAGLLRGQVDGLAGVAQALALAALAVAIGLLRSRQPDPPE